MSYSRIFGSNFPSQSIPLGTHKDVDDTVVGLINQYNAYVQTGNMVVAGKFYAQNKAQLEPYMLDMTYINRLEEEIYNTGVYAMEQNVENGAPVISDNEPTVEQSVNAFWFQDY